MIDAGFVHALLQKISHTGHLNSSHRESRNAILVGNSVDGDISSLQKLTNRKWSIQDFPYILVFGMQFLRRAMLRGLAQKRHETVLIKLGISYKFLHNGSNDSRFTVKALLAVALWNCPFNKQCFSEMRTR
ncbi:hypothetical protein N431DRAFT_434313 [Stipitochalara longipes BDJ]|nr:hypothetical protein N431DRAFT_434313 [Stipitochalara longipes BDJ]